MCPFLELADSRCAANQSLHHLDDALRLCADRYEECPVYCRRLLGHESRFPIDDSVAAR